MTVLTQEMARSMEAMWRAMDEAAADHPGLRAEMEKLKKEHPHIRAIDEYGAAGPVGIGYGRMGGHAIG